MRRKALLLAAITATLIMGLTPIASAVPKNQNYGTFQIQTDLGTTPPEVDPIIDPTYAHETQDFTLSDDHHLGTFKAKFRITDLDKPAFDTFKVTNNTNLPITFGYAHEDQNIQPQNSARNMSELLACFNALCDLNTYFPSGVLVPPVPLGVIPAHTTSTFTVGMKLAPTANRQAWDGTTLMTTLYFKNLL